MKRFHRPSPAPAHAAASRAARLAAVLCAVALIAPATAFAQSQSTHHKPRHHRAAAAKPAAGQIAQPAAPPAPVAPPQPKWPANDPPSPPAITFNSQGLQIVADNASLSSILNQVSTETGAKVEGFTGDERVFGDYGPGQPREVLAQLLSGVHYNVLIVGDEALGEPLRVLLSPRPSGPAPPSRPQPPEQDEDFQPEPEEQPYQPPIIRPNMIPQQPPNNRPMTPQERLQEMQERQRQMQIQQQEQQQQQQPQ
jgi:hypothetical protein